MAIHIRRMLQADLHHVMGLTQIADVSRRQISEAHERERERLKRHYDEQIEEAQAGARGRGAKQRNRESRALVGRLRRARDELVTRRPPNVRLEADLLALHLVPDTTVEVAETWTDPNGEGFELFYDWKVGSGRPTSVPGADGGEIETLALCRQTHVVDMGALARCPVCEEDTCGACSDGVQSTCAVCSLELCGRCAIGRSDRGSWVQGDAVLCPSCHDPEVADTDGAVTTLALGNGFHACVDPWSVRITDAAGDTVVDHVLPERRAAVAYPQIDELEALVGSEVGLRHLGHAHLDDARDFEVAFRILTRWSIRRHGGRSELLDGGDDAEAVLSQFPVPADPGTDVVTGFVPAMSRWLEVVGGRYGLGTGPVVEASRHQVRHELTGRRSNPGMRRLCAEIDANPTVTEFRLEDLSVEERSSLPVELLLAGAVSARAARDGDLLVLIIRSVSRRELAVLEEGCITMWVTTEGNEAETDLRLRFAAALGDGGPGLSIRAHGMPSEPTGTHVVADHRRWLLSLEASDAAGHRILSHDLGEVEDPDPRSHLDRIAALAGPALETVPRPVSGSEAKSVGKILAGATVPTANVSLTVLSRIEVDRVDLGEHGLSRIRGQAPDLVTETAEWDRAAGHAIGPVLPGLGVISPMLTCELGGHRAEILRYGPYLLLTITDPSGSRSVWRLDDLPHFPSGAMAAELLGTGIELPRPMHWVPPPVPSEVPFTVLGHRLVDRTVEYDKTPSPRSPTQMDAEDRFYEAIGTAHAPPVELAGELPSQFREDLVSVAGQEPTVTRPYLRARVTEQWVAEDHGPDDVPAVTVEYLCETDGPNLGPAHLDSAGPALLVDRSGHVVDHAVTCPYCVEVVCGSCPEPMKTCSACGIRICARCLPEPGWCEACGSMKKVGLLGRRSLPGRPKHAVRGRDPVHEVTYMLDTAIGVMMLMTGRGAEPFETEVTLPAPLADQFAEHTGGPRSEWLSGRRDESSGMESGETD